MVPKVDKEEKESYVYLDIKLINKWIINKNKTFSEVEETVQVC